MSLIHDALKSMDTAVASPAAPAATARPRAATAPRGGRPAWLDGALAFAIVVAAGGLGWVLWQSQKQPQPLPPVVAVAAPVLPVATPPALAAPQPLVEVPAVAGATPVVDLPAASAQPAAVAAATAPAPMPSAVAPAPSAPALVAQVQAAPAAAAPMSASGVMVAQAATGQADVRTATPRPAAAPRPARATRAVALPVVMPAPAPVLDETPVELRFARFVAAMKNNQTADAERELAALKARLPAGSLGLLRAQAWFDLRAGNDAAAAEQYRAILDRMPGDEEASINLASIHSRRGKPEEARATLDTALRLSPDSAALRSALGQFTPNARQ
ncbi:tetratricopeptide repeat protein [Acidovorax sp. LjRoot66]|uniref:tetratricopeptide repeat protein n=1 Tax=Acidovorax sp. LjRoot66 TaxID=3342334 RepID=UPI003ECD855D